MNMTIKIDNMYALIAFTCLILQSVLIVLKVAGATTIGWVGIFTPLYVLGGLSLVLIILAVTYSLLVKEDK